MTRILLFLFTITTFVAQAQLKVQLKSGTYLIEEGTFKQLSNTQPTYGVGLWDRVVLAEDKKALTDLGVELGHYLPKNAFEVKIPACYLICILILLMVWHIKIAEQHYRTKKGATNYRF